MKTLDLTNLLEKAESIIYDGRANKCEFAKIPVQEIELDENKYRLFLTLELINK